MSETSPDVREIGGLRAALAIGLFSAAALGLQVALSRLLSVTLWYHFAFLIVSTALLGYGLAGATLALRREAPDLRRTLIRAGLGQAATTLLALFTLRLLPFEPFRLALDPLQILWALLLQAVLVAPFFCSGLAVGSLLIARPKAAGRLYGFDLFGAALGAAGALLLLPLLGPLGTATTAAAGAMLASALFLPTRGLLRAWLTAVLALALSGAVAEAAFGVRITADKRLGDEAVEDVLADPARAMASAWDPAARLDLIRPDADRARLLVLLDGGAAVVRVPPITRPWAQIPPLRDATALSFFVQPPRKVLVLGAGAGWEVAGALSHGASEVTGVELAPTLSTWLRGPLRDATRGLVDDPRVRWIDGEARAFVHRSAARFDQIISIHTISNAAAVSGALDLAESHTLTVEALAEYLAHLEPDGLLYLTRPEAQLPKLVATAAKVLRDAGRAPRAHLVALRLPEPGQSESFTAGLLVFEAPLDEDALSRVSAAAAKVGMAQLLSPDTAEPRADAPRSVRRLWAARAGLPLAGDDPAALEPATDDRPFFNRRRSWSRLRLADLRGLYQEGARARLAMEDRPVAELSLALLLLESLGIAAIFSGLLAWRRHLPPGSLPVQAYFALLGVGFAAVELGLVHRLGLLLGRPGLTFAVSVAGLLLWSGLGSSLLRPVMARVGGGRILLLSALLIACTGLLIGVVEDRLLGMSTPVRTLGCLLAIAPAGLGLGLPFPLGLSMLSEADATERGRAFMVNGFASVVGATLSVVIATGAGLSAVFAGGALTYVLAGLLLRWWPDRGGLV